MMFIHVRTRHGEVVSTGLCVRVCMHNSQFYAF